MPDSPISDLVEVSQVLPADSFVLEQNGTAKRLAGQTLLNWLVAYADGHGGINSISLVSKTGLISTYRITLADTTYFNYQVLDGRGIESLTWATSGEARNGQVHTGTFQYNDGTSSSITINDGLKGDAGDNSYVWIRYSSVLPHDDQDMTDIPSDYIGVYSGNSSLAPADYREYSWFKIKGERGSTGSPASLNSISILYAESESGTSYPSSIWYNNPPAVPQGHYLWTRVSLTFNDGRPVIFYTVSRFGLDGSGSVSSVNETDPDENGNVSLDASKIPNGNTNVAAQLSSLIYQSGDSASGIAVQAFGYVSTSNYVSMSFMLPKMISSGASVSVSSVVPNMRTVSGGLIGGSSTADIAQYIYNTTIKGCVLTALFNKNASWGAPDNTPISGVALISFTIS